MQQSFLIIIMFLCFYEQQFAQADSVCRAELVDYVMEMSKVEAPTGNQVYALDYTVKTVYNPKISSTVETINFKSRFSKDLMVLESNKVDVYADTTDSFMVSHDHKTINWHAGGKNKFANVQAENLAGQQLRLINISKIKSCETQQINGKEYHFSRLQLPSTEAKTLKMNELTILYSLEANRIYQVNMYYIAGAPVKRQTITYKKLDYNSLIKLKGTARGRVLNKSLLPLSRYKDYSLTINR